MVDVEMLEFGCSNHPNTRRCKAETLHLFRSEVTNRKAEKSIFGLVHFELGILIWTEFFARSSAT